MFLLYIFAFPYFLKIILLRQGSNFTASWILRYKQNGMCIPLSVYGIILVQSREIYRIELFQLPVPGYIYIFKILLSIDLNQFCFYSTYLFVTVAVAACSFCIIYCRVKHHCMTIRNNDLNQIFKNPDTMNTHYLIMKQQPNLPSYSNVKVDYYLCQSSKLLLHEHV